MWHGTGTERILSAEAESKNTSEQAKHSERVTGIEPAFSAWEADVLPLNYTRRTVTHAQVSATRRLFVRPAGSPQG